MSINRHLLDKEIVVHIHNGILSSVQFSRSVVSNSLRAHAACQASLSITKFIQLHPRVYSNSCPLCWWCHPTISPSVVLFSSCPQSSPTSGSFQMSQLFPSGGQNIGVSASITVLSMEYYSAITRNTVESILMSWMNLEPIIQSEVSQKEKGKYHIVMHISGI